jgi:hypothetical protein
MLQKLSHHIEACVERAADCRRRAAQAADPTMKLELQDMEGRWTHLATATNSWKASSGFCSAPRTIGTEGLLRNEKTEPDQSRDP